MTNLQRLKNSNNNMDLLLADFIEKNNAVDLVNNNKNFNRGDFFEMCLTHEKVKRNGLHKKSDGDIIINNKVYEIKYLTKKTGASLDRLGTIASAYIIGFNSGKELIIKVIDKKELITIKEISTTKTREKITYQNNINKGVIFNR